MGVGGAVIAAVAVAAAAAVAIAGVRARVHHGSMSARHLWVGGSRALVGAPYPSRWVCAGPYTCACPYTCAAARRRCPALEPRGRPRRRTAARLFRHPHRALRWCRHRAQHRRLLWWRHQRRLLRAGRERARTVYRDWRQRPCTALGWPSTAVMDTERDPGGGAAASAAGMS